MSTEKVNVFVKQFLSRIEEENSLEQAQTAWKSVDAAISTQIYHLKGKQIQLEEKVVKAKDTATDALLNHCISKGLTWIGLISEPGQDGFYSSIGFKTMNNHIPMIYKFEEKNALN